ncbi:MAG: four helix bundle protein [Candidatus Aminicenantes bacterium]|nr:four helix bundle protein [Candidatus Aminicenantes bacterium]
MKQSLIKEKSYSFALEIIGLYKVLLKQNEFVLSKQVLKSGTSIGANVEEALAGQSRADFPAKMSIASKEARETGYWLRLLRDSGIISKTKIGPLLLEAESIANMLTASVKTTQNSYLKTHNSKPKT